MSRSRVAWPRSAVVNLGSAFVIATALLQLPATPSVAFTPHSILPTLRLGYLVGSESLAGTLDPPLVADTVSAEVIALEQANLVRILPSGRIVPDLATWHVSKNGLVYTFSIRTNARFGNGHAVTARDAVFSMQRALAPSLQGGVALTYLSLIRGAAPFQQGKSPTIAGLKVVGPRTLRITITQPAAYFLGALAYPAADVLDRAVVAGKPIGTPDPQTGLFTGNYLTSTCAANQGAGPFRFVCRNAGSTFHSFYKGNKPTYTLVPNPYYYGHKPHITLELVPYSSRSTGYTAYLSGKLDTTILPPVYSSQWRGRNRQYHRFPSSSVYYLVPNVRMAPFTNVHCRRAVAFAIDRNFIVSSVLGGVGAPLYSLAPLGMLGWYNGKDNPHYSPSQARRELAQCPGRATHVAIIYPDIGPTISNVFHYIESELTKVGLNLTLKPLPMNEYASIASHPLTQSGTQLVSGGWSADYPDPQDYCTVLLRSGAHYNVGDWSDRRYDRLVDRADATAARKARAILYMQAQHIALSQGGFISLYQDVGEALIKPYVHGMVGSEAYSDLVPVNDDWSRVSVSKH